MKQNDSIQNKDLNQTAGIQTGDINVDKLTILKNLLEPKQGDNWRLPPNGEGHYPPNGEGREVKLKDALQCINLFMPSMTKHGFTRTGEGNIPKIPKIRKITEYEEFGGANLLEWMVKVVQKYDLDKQGKNMTIRLMLGIYTDTFLTEHLPNDPDRIFKKKNRITIFLVPHYEDSLQRILEDEDATAYELGGLHP